MSPILQNILAAIGASGLMSLVITSIISRQLNKAYAKQDQREKLRSENQLLMMSLIDKQSDMVHLMARKLHDSGVINGDLGELDKKYKELYSQYNENIKSLALEILKK